MVLAHDSLPQLNEVLDPLDIEQNHDELLRYLGYRGPKSKDHVLSDELEVEIQRGQSLLRPKGIYSVYPAQCMDSRHLKLGDITLQGKVATFLKRADSIAIFVVTVGQGITERSRIASDAGDPVAAWALDAFGSYAAESAAEALAQRLQRQFPAVGAVSARYSPGYCGLHLKQQRGLFSLVDAAAIGVTLLDSMLMQPTKSISGVLGIGPAAAFAAGSSPCERCNDLECSMRR